MEIPLQAQSREKPHPRFNDSTLLRFGLGSEYLKISPYRRAVARLECAVEHSRDYSVAWKLLGKTNHGFFRPYLI